MMGSLHTDADRLAGGRCRRRARGPGPGGGQHPGQAAHRPGQCRGGGRRARAPHFIARSTAGQILSESYWEPVADGRGHARAFAQIWSWLQDAAGEDGLGVRELEDLLYKRSGLLGLSGISNDLRALRTSEDPRAAEAIDYFVYRIGQTLGALVAALGGLDARVFTAGIGENDAEIRRRVCDDAAWLGIELDAAANETGARRISPAGASPSVWVIPTNEEQMIANHTLRLLQAA